MNTVRGALATAEAELVESGIDKKKVQSALEEVRSLLRPISFRHFERPEEFRHKVGELLPYVTKAGDRLGEGIQATDDAWMFCKTPLESNREGKASEGTF